MIFRKLARMPLKGMKTTGGGYLAQSATITSRSTRGAPLKLPEPFPYDEKRFTFFSDLFDPTIVKLSHENAKIISVEGPIGVGKSAFCQALAEEFDMKYFPQPTMDDIYILSSGRDLREFDDQLPVEIRTYDHRNFCTNPYGIKAELFQLNMLYLRFYQYVDAICHLFNTGQGVVVERYYSSDYCFLKAMSECGFVSKEFVKIYFTIRENVSTFFPKPHLIVYLDIPVPVVQERIRTRNYSYEQNSPALTTQYLTCLENLWKNDYLKVASKDSEILIYDWSDGGNIDVVIDDIEDLDFDIMRSDKKFISWWIIRRDLSNYRKIVSNNPYHFDTYFSYPWYRYDKAFKVFEKKKLWIDVLNGLPENRYDYGYNYVTGDNIFKIFFTWGRKNVRKPFNYIL